MKGYWNREDATEEAIVDGWFHSGDMAKVDEDGYFFIVDRKKELIIRGGYNVYPREIEEVLYEHDGVLEAAVIGVPDDSMGEEVGAAVVLKQGQDVSADDLKAYVKERGRRLQVPAQDLVRRRAAQGPDGQDPQARDRSAGGGQDAADGRRLRQPRHAARRRRRRRRPPLVPGRRGRQARRPPRHAAVEGRAPRARATAPSWPRSPIGQSDVAPSKKRPPLQGRRLAGEPGVPPARPGLPGGGQDGRRPDLATRGSTSAPSGACASRRERRSTRSRRRTSRLLNPAALKATLDTGGRNLVQGSAQPRRTTCRGRRTSRRWSTRRRSRSARTSRSRPGAVVLRTELFELIQYEPSTAQVRETPLLLVPPMINKFYVADLAPGRSMIEYFVGAGPAVLHDLVAQPGRAPRRVGARRLRLGGARGARGGRDDHRLRRSRT